MIRIKLSKEYSSPTVVSRQQIKQSTSKKKYEQFQPSTTPPSQWQHFSYKKREIMISVVIVSSLAVDL